MNTDLLPRGPWLGRRGPSRRIGDCSGNRGEEGRGGLLRALGHPEGRLYIWGGERVMGKPLAFPLNTERGETVRDQGQIHISEPTFGGTPQSRLW